MAHLRQNGAVTASIQVRTYICLRLRRRQRIAPRQTHSVSERRAEAAALAGAPPPKSDRSVCLACRCGRRSTSVLAWPLVTVTVRKTRQGLAYSDVRVRGSSQ